MTEPPQPLSAISALKVGPAGADAGRVRAREDDEVVARLLSRPGNLRTVVQPLVRLADGTCAGYDSLTRIAEWPATSPQAWFAAAERSGRAADLEAAAVAGALRVRADLPSGQLLGIPVTATTLTRSQVAAALLAEPHLRGVVLTLVSRPGQLPAPGSAPAESLLQLRERGAALAVDVSALSAAELEAAAALEPEHLRLDRVLVRGVATSAVRQRLVAVLAAATRAGGPALVAKGVEQPDDARALQACGVALAQGWLLGRPQPTPHPPTPEVAAWLRDVPSAATSGIASLVHPVGAGGSPSRRGWRAACDDEGRPAWLRQGAEPWREVASLPVVRSTCTPAEAARQLLEGPLDRPVVVVDAHGRLLGVVEPRTLLSEALGVVEHRRGRIPAPVGSGGR